MLNLFGTGQSTVANLGVAHARLTRRYIPAPPRAQATIAYVELARPRPERRAALLESYHFDINAQARRLCPHASERCDPAQAAPAMSAAAPPRRGPTPLDLLLSLQPAQGECGCSGLQAAPCTIEPQKHWLLARHLPHLSHAGQNALVDRPLQPALVDRPSLPWWTANSPLVDRPSLPWQAKMPWWQAVSPMVDSPVQPSLPWWSHLSHEANWWTGHLSHARRPSLPWWTAHAPMVPSPCARRTDRRRRPSQRLCGSGTWPSTTPTAACTRPSRSAWTTWTGGCTASSSRSVRALGLSASSAAQCRASSTGSEDLIQVAHYLGASILHIRCSGCLLLGGETRALSASAVLADLVRVASGLVRGTSNASASCAIKHTALQPRPHDAAGRRPGQARPRTLRVETSGARARARAADAMAGSGLMTRLVPAPTTQKMAARAAVLVQCWGPVFLTGGRRCRPLAPRRSMQAPPWRPARLGMPALRCARSGRALAAGAERRRGGGQVRSERVGQAAQLFADLARAAAALELAGRGEAERTLHRVTQMISMGVAAPSIVHTKYTLLCALASASSCEPARAGSLHGLPAPQLRQCWGR